MSRTRQGQSAATHSAAPTGAGETVTAVATVATVDRLDPLQPLDAGAGAGSAGTAVRSTQSGDVHAPVFDLDTPADVQGAHDGMFALVVPPLKRRECIRIARRLVRCGFADPTWAERFVGSVRSGSVGSGPTVLELTVPLRAEPGRVAGHTTVYVGQAMSFQQSCRLAKALGCLVDAQQRALSQRRHEWRVRTA